MQIHRVQKHMANEVRLHDVNLKKYYSICVICATDLCLDIVCMFII